MFSRIVRALWGDLSKEDIKRFGMLAITFLFLIGTYWLMRPLKDALFINIVGKLYLPYAKIASLCFIIPLLLFYAKLVDWFSRDKLFYILTTFYASLFAIIAFMLTHPTIGIANTVTSKYRLLGWVIYLGVESFGSLIPGLFWAFVASTTDTSSAKKGFALIVAGGQIGSITGPTLATYAEFFGMPMLAAFVACGIIIIPFLIWNFVRVFPLVHAAPTQGAKKKGSGPIEGLRLLLSKPYLLGILGVSTLYEVVGTILDYQMKFAASETYNSVEKVAAFFGLYGQCANGLSLAFALLGTSYIIRRFGLTLSLIAFPATVAAVVCCVWFAPSLWMLFGAMVAVKGLSYALNNPCKEIMYIPTSKDIKFKAKSWIEGFGGRGAKAAGSGINAMFTQMADLMIYGSIISLGIIGVWIVVAYYVGTKNDELTKEGSIIQ